MKFFIWFSDKLFSEKVNNIICWTGICLMLGYVAFQAIRYLFQINI